MRPEVVVKDKELVQRLESEWLGGAAEGTPPHAGLDALCGGGGTDRRDGQEDAAVCRLAGVFMPCPPQLP